MEFAKDKLEWIEFDLLNPYSHIIQRVFLRHGGTSQHHFSSLNAGNNVGDHPDNVKVNRNLIRNDMNIPRIVYAEQNHGIEVAHITADTIHTLVKADALYTTMHNVGLAITHADCQAVFFYDPKQEVIAAAHCGWRGNVKNIFYPLIDAMKRSLKTDPNDLIACVSPSLCPEHAEFKNFKEEFPEEFWSYQVKPNHFDLWAITQKQLNGCGILDKNIEFARICTFCEKKDYFSHRREKKTGRHASVIAITI